MQENTRADLVRLLAWYGEAGVDCALGEQPFDWLEKGARAPGADFVWPSTESAGIPPGVRTAPSTPRPQAPTAQRPQPPQGGPATRNSAGFRQAAPLPADATRAPPARFATAPPDAAETTARRIAAAVPDLSALATALHAFDGCALKATAKSTCVWRGAEQARVMIVGEAPGRDEDLEGKPFVGRAGQLLDRMLKAVELDEGNVHITNVVYWRPPGNRTPTTQETQVCRPFLERQIALVEPEFLLLLGGAAAKAMLDVGDGIMKLRGKWRDAEIGGRRLRVMATLHPAYLLRTPAAKRLAWRDFLALKAALEQSAKH
ncbi:MAG: uracil-DNA glycosylase [Hyphomicrobiaceae bacterium]|nr:uracil-DNA glycosylase [Hyphomicrobiaceae bacterium]